MELREALTEAVDALTRSGWYDNKGQWQNGDSALVGRAKAVLDKAPYRREVNEAGPNKLDNINLQSHSNKPSDEPRELFLKIAERLRRAADEYERRAKADA